MNEKRIGTKNKYHLAITPFLDLPLTAKICMTVAVILLVYRHKENIKRIKNHTESKIQWM